MRIVGGTARGRHLVAAPDGTRPTSDRAREGLFSSLTTLLDLDGARVLDLYAGTGAVGLEALSRGAAEAVFVESGRRARAALDTNVAALRLGPTRVLPRSVAATLQSTPGAPFDLVFADPPYALADGPLATVLGTLVDRGWVAPDGVIVVERSVRAPAPGWPECVTPVQQRKYGDTVLWYGRRR